MTKKLTEQWRNNELKEDWYYVKTKNWYNPKESENDILYYKPNTFRNYDAEVVEVLCESPSYDEYNDLIQQNVNQESAIETYIERIKELEEQIPNGTWYTEKSHNELLNKIEQLQKRLEIATKVLKKLTRHCDKWEIAREALKEMEGVK